MEGLSPRRSWPGGGEGSGRGRGEGTARRQELKSHAESWITDEGTTAARGLCQECRGDAFWPGQCEVVLFPAAPRGHQALPVPQNPELKPLLRLAPGDGGF